MIFVLESLSLLPERQDHTRSLYPLVNPDDSFCIPIIMSSTSMLVLYFVD